MAKPMTPIADVWRKAAALARQTAESYGPMPAHALQRLAQTLERRAEEPPDGPHQT